MTNAAGDRTEDSINIDPPETSVRWTGTSIPGTSPEASKPVKKKSQERHRGENQGPITKRSRPTHTQAHKAMDQGDDKEPDEGKLGLLLEKARLQKQLSQLREEMQMNQS